MRFDHHARSATFFVTRISGTDSTSVAVFPLPSFNTIRRGRFPANMRIIQFWVQAALLAFSSPVVSSFSVSRKLSFYAITERRSSSSASTIRRYAALNDINVDCGCSDSIVYSGEPSDRAKSLDARQAIRASTFYNVNGDLVTFDQLIGTPESNTKPVIAVFLRSLG